MRGFRFRNFMSLGGLLLAVVMPSLAATEFLVTTGDDAGPGSLREGILHLNSTGGGTIRFSNVAAVTLQGELPEIQANVVIEADGTNRVVLDGNLRGRVLSVASNSTVVLRGLRITGGLVRIPCCEYVEGQGGGILNRGDLTLIRCSVDGNSIGGNYYVPAFGGGVYNGGFLSLVSCTISNNSAAGGDGLFGRVPGRGGGIYSKGTTVINSTTVANNNAYGGGGVYDPSECCSDGGIASGGGIYSESGSVHVTSTTFVRNFAFGGYGLYGRGGDAFGGGASGTNLYFVNCTFSQNEAIAGSGRDPQDVHSYGGQINADGLVDLRSCTVVSGNAAIAAGVSATTIRIQNTIIADNGPSSSGDVAGILVSLGHNLIEGLLSPPSTTDIVGLNPMLGPLQDNGGPTFTHLPLAGSPAIDAGFGGELRVDQRGFARTKDNLTFTNAQDGDGTDIGAVELEYAERLLVTTNYVTNLEDSGPGSLRDAIIKANAAYGGEILFSNVTGSIVLQSDLPILSPDVVVRGPGYKQLTVDGGFHKVFTLGRRISGLTIRQGAPGIGGNGKTEVVDCALVACAPAIESFGDLLLVNSIVRDCGPDWGWPALHLFGKAVIEHCVFSNNFMRAHCPDSPGSEGHQGGAAILLESGAVSVVDSVFVKNTVQGYVGCSCGGAPGYGGAIHVVKGEISLLGCSFLNNRALGDSRGSYGGSAGGAAIYFSDGILRATNCTFSGNEATGGDGGIAEGSLCPNSYGGSSFGGAVDCVGGSASFANSTFSSNRSVGGKGGYDFSWSLPTPGGTGIGGAIYLSGWFYDADGNRRPGGSIDLLNCTIVSNQVVGGPFLGRLSSGDGLGGGVVLYSTNNSIRNSIFFGNTRTMSLSPSNAVILSSDGCGSMNSLGNNLFGVTNELIGIHGGDLINVDPMLGPLRDNGGNVLTHALLAGSPAIDAGRGGGLTVDARGQPRPIDDPTVPNDPNGDGTDIGAFEVNHILAGTETLRKGNDILVRFTTVSDKTYGVEYRPEVGEGAWTALPGIVIGTGGVVTYRDVDAAKLPRRFYRFFERSR